MDSNFEFDDLPSVEVEAADSVSLDPDIDNPYPDALETEALDSLYPQTPEIWSSEPDRDDPNPDNLSGPTDTGAHWPDPDPEITSLEQTDSDGFTPEEIAAFESLSEQVEEVDAWPVGMELEDDSNAASMDADIPPEEIQNIPPDEEIFLDGLEPDSIYEKNGYIYQTDEMGRPGMVSGILQLEEGIRSSQQTDIGKQGIDGDEGGHLIGTRFNGPPDAFNILPQNSELNRGEWKSMENEWASTLESEHEVNVQIAPIYEDDTIRPSSYYVTSWIDGEPHERQFLNQAPTNKG